QTYRYGGSGGLQPAPTVFFFRMPTRFQNAYTMRTASPCLLPGNCVEEGRSEGLENIHYLSLAVHSRAKRRHHTDHTN
ncbi:hypothetical protein, partial [Chloroflexus sp. MS-G]|uniref:hypothetical protein n=1 Tax=Chloroflexus sp. MS-G TaxID=1521187 RepID=UPI001F3DF023